MNRALGQCQAAIVYCRDLLPPEVADDKGRAEVAEAGAAAAEAYESFAAFLTDLADKATGDWALGEQRYSHVAAREGTARGRCRLAARRAVAANTRRSTHEMRALCRDTWGDEDWRTRLDTVNEDRPTTPDEMREGYEQWTETARAFLHEHQLVSFPEGEECSVEPSPPFQRPVLAVASYFQPPAMRPSLKGRFNVPYPPEGTSDKDLAERLADNSYANMATTSVHEAYPGHHWHFAWLQADAPPIRRLVTTPYFVEGWALYTERMMREQGFFTDPSQDLCHLAARISRCRPHRGRHELALRRHDVRRGRRVHAHELAADRGCGPRRSHAVLRLADASGFVPHRLARDRALARALARGRQRFARLPRPRRRIGRHADRAGRARAVRMNRLLRGGARVRLHVRVRPRGRVRERRTYVARAGVGRDRASRAEIVDDGFGRGRRSRRYVQAPGSS